MLTATQLRAIRGPNVNIAAITEERVFKALKILRSAGRLSVSPLAELDLVQLRLRGEGVHDSAQGRAWMLGKVLDEIVWEHLGQLRSAEQPDSREALTPAAELELLTTDFRLGNADLEAWSLVYARFISLAQPSVGDLAEHLNVVRRTLERRAKRGYALLSDVLKDAEREASARIDRMPGAPAHARIQVEESQPLQPGAGSEAGSPVAMAEAINALVRDDEQVLRLGAEQVRTFVRGSFQNLDEYRASRIAEWSLPRYRLDERFVALSMLVDSGSETASDRWVSEEVRYDQMAELMETVDSPALVLLGSPGSGKSTLLRRLELELNTASVCGQDEDRVTFLVPLNDVRGIAAGSEWSPLGWLAERWRTRHRMLPSLEELLAQGRVTLLLDALNEIPHSEAAVLRDRIIELKGFIHQYILGQPGNRVVISCRSLDYSAPLSTPRMRVPQVRIEPMEDEQVKSFLQAYSPLHWQETWRQLAGSRQLEVLRSPYFLRLLSEQIETTGRMPLGRADLFTGFVRQTLRREVERENRLFSPNALMTKRDIRRITHGRWTASHDLPEQGILLPKLAVLAHKMQSVRTGGEGLQIRVDFNEALDFLADERGEDIVRAGVDLNVLDEDPGSDEVMFFHQLLQEYFSARKLADSPDPTLLYQEWSAERIETDVASVIEALDSSETLPPLPATGWEETASMAAPMAADPPAFLLGLMASNLALAGRVAAQPDMNLVLPDSLLDKLRRALVERSRDPAADLRARIAAGLALGPLGDPRLERGTGPQGEYLLGPLVSVPAGRYPVGGDAPLRYLGGQLDHHLPRHDQDLAAFRIGQFAVTNAEWACFIASGAYEDERWWDTEAGRALLRGEGTAEGPRTSARYWWQRFRADPSIVESQRDTGEFDEEKYQLWQRRLSMDAAALEDHLREYFPNQQPFRAPLFWKDGAFNNPVQPVVGISWYEARAYCAWLSAQSGLCFRLPTEPEWEAAATGPDGQPYAGAETFGLQVGNTMEVRLRRTAPVGVFPAGDSPYGAADMMGNTWDWTESQWGPDVMEPTYRYPYDREDGREDPSIAGAYRIVRGGAWFNGSVSVRSDYRGRLHSYDRTIQHGLRVLVEA